MSHLGLGVVVSLGRRLTADPVPSSVNPLGNDEARTRSTLRSCRVNGGWGRGSTPRTFYKWALVFSWVTPGIPLMLSSIVLGCILAPTPYGESLQAAFLACITLVARSSFPSAGRSAPSRLWSPTRHVTHDAQHEKVAHQSMDRGGMCAQLSPSPAVKTFMLTMRPDVSSKLLKSGQWSTREIQR